MALSPKSRAEMISRNTTFFAGGVGQFDANHRAAPGTVETRADSADIDRAMSSARTNHPAGLQAGCGSSSYIVTTGPGRTDTISPRTP